MAEVPGNGRIRTRREFLKGVFGLGVAPLVLPRKSVWAAEVPRTVTFAATAGGSAIGLLAQVIKKHKLDLKHGITLDVKSFDPAGAEKATLLRQVDAGFFAVVTLAKVNLEGQNLVFLSPLHANHGAVICRANAPYTSMQDLKGKKIATLDKVSGLYTSMQVLMKEMGMNFDRDFQVITAPPLAVKAFLERGDVEAILLFEPIISRMISTGEYKEILTPSVEWLRLTGSPMFMIGLTVHQDWLEANRETAKALTRVFYDAAIYIRANPGVFEEEKEFLGLKTPREIEIVRKRMSPIYFTVLTEKAVKNAEHILDRAVELQILKERPKGSVFTTL